MNVYEYNNGYSKKPSLPEMSTTQEDDSPLHKAEIQVVSKQDQTQLNDDTEVRRYCYAGLGELTGESLSGNCSWGGVSLGAAGYNAKGFLGTAVDSSCCLL